ncbi:hypothetical protein HY750_01355 [Candidatus Kuenenbacteria bacterium]|nr:hypothetical protein [Candidatus Kuenenbacteria bacterium]
MENKNIGISSSWRSGKTTLSIDITKELESKNIEWFYKDFYMGYNESNIENIPDFYKEKIKKEIENIKKAELFIFDEIEGIFKKNELEKLKFLKEILNKDCKLIFIFGPKMEENDIEDLEKIFGSIKNYNLSFEVSAEEAEKFLKKEYNVENKQIIDFLLKITKNIYFLKNFCEEMGGFSSKEEKIPLSSSITIEDIKKVFFERMYYYWQGAKKEKEYNEKWEELSLK